MATDDEELGIYGRSNEALLELPFKYRWEFTRRHPYYLVHWRSAQTYRRGAYQPADPQLIIGYWAALILGHIGVTGEPVDPACSADALGDDPQVDSSFLCGPVQPMTYRNMLTNMIAALPPAELLAAGALLMNAGAKEYGVEGDDEGRTLQRRKAIASLMQIASSAFDSYLDAPLFYIHLAASKRSINESMSRHVNVWKPRRNIKEARQHTTRFDDYLRAWDFREGWTGAGYARAQCRTLKQTAAEMKRSPSTIAKQYCAAFERITGHPYRTSAWVRMFAPLHDDAGGEGLVKSHIRRFQRLVNCRNPPTVAESTLQGQHQLGSHNVGIVESLTAIDSEVDLIDAAMDIQEMISRGRTDVEIATELEVSQELIDFVRERIREDGQDSSA